jgi:hypothetical protein
VGYAGAPLTRRMSERELNLDSSYKKQRATSAHALHRKVDDSGMQLTTLDLRYYYTTQGTLSYRFFVNTGCFSKTGGSRNRSVQITNLGQYFQCHNNFVVVMPGGFGLELDLDDKKHFLD